MASKPTRQFIDTFEAGKENPNVFSAETMNKLVYLLNALASVEGHNSIKIEEPKGDGPFSNLGISIDLKALKEALKNVPEANPNQPTSGSMSSTSCLCRYS